jgi:hypothetical protein
MEPVVLVMRISCSGIVASAAMSMASGLGGRRDGALVRGRRVIVVGRWPPRAKVVRWRRICPWRDLGSEIKFQLVRKRKRSDKE